VDGTIFDHENILNWLKKHSTNPVDGKPLKSSELIKLNFLKNDEGEYVDPVTYKVFTDNTHLVALKNTGNVFGYDTVERLNIKEKMWKDLVSDESFTRADIITLQDPQNIASRNLSSFRYIKDGVSTLTPEQEAERSATVNTSALGSTSKILKAKEAVEKARLERQKGGDINRNPSAFSKSKPIATSKSGAAVASASQTRNFDAHSSKAVPYNAAMHTTGKAAASFTSTGLTPHTSGERAILTDEEYMLKPRRVKQKGYARIHTTLGELNIELQPEHAPKAVWNFVQLVKKGFYNGITFHRNIRNFMIQGGDPTGTGKGGTSIWGKNFADEFDGPNTHDVRGIVSMANKGKNTNSSQFFITYRAAKHLDRKHTIFGRVVGGMDVLSKLENAPTDSETNRPNPEIFMEEVVVFVDPFEEWMKEKKASDEREREKEEVRRMGGTEDERMTWTGKRIREDGTVEGLGGDASVGKYLKAALAERKGIGMDKGDEDEIIGDWVEEEPVKKKVRATGGFGNFDGW
jgi:peptidyl-prolyl cis-trans isomerase-like protein 2